VQIYVLSSTLIDPPAEFPTSLDEPHHSLRHLPFSQRRINYQTLISTRCSTNGASFVT